jgi:hypothetical protein
MMPRLRPWIVPQLVILMSVGWGCGPGVSGEGSTPPHTSPLAGASDFLATTTTTPSTGPRPAASLPSVEEHPANSAWMQQAMRHPDADVRLKTLDTWVQQGRDQGLGPLMGALTDVDDRVQARALELIVQDWQRAQETHER